MGFLMPIMSKASCFSGFPSLVSPPLANRHAQQPPKILLPPSLATTLFRGRISSNYFSALSYLFPLFPTLHQKLEITVGKATEVFHVAKSRWSVCTLLELSVAFDTGDNYYFKDETLSLLCSWEDHAPFLLFQLLWHDILGFSSHVFPSLPQSSVL